MESNKLPKTACMPKLDLLCATILKIYGGVGGGGEFK